MTDMATNIRDNAGRIIDARSEPNVRELYDAGFALHWLHEKTKRPIGNDWSTAPVATWDHLQKSYRPGFNVGVRLGEPSLLSDGSYLHCLDVDIRDPELADEAWAALTKLLPGVDIWSLPSVVSGSGGESRHLYFTAADPLTGRKLAFSDGKIGNPRGGWSHAWEIELFSSGKHCVLPPSIHPDSGLPYRWEREFHWGQLALDIGLGPWISMDTLAAAGAVQPETFGYETREPLDLKPGQMERELGQIEISDLDYDDWIRVGQAIHHQTGGSAAGLDLWIEHTRRSSKFTGDKQVREMRRIKWRSFGRYRGNPVTFATIRSWAADARSAAMVAEFDDLDDLGTTPDSPETDDFDDLIGDIAAPLSDMDEMEAVSAAAEAKDPTSWVSLLEVTERGAFATTLHNVELIVKNDRRTAGLAQLNEFTGEIVQRRQPGVKPKSRANQAQATRQLDGQEWVITDTLNGELWSDDRDLAVRSVLEAPKRLGGYGIKFAENNLRGAIKLAAKGSAFHPVKEYLESLSWDRKPRVEQLFATYLGSDDDAYTRDVSRLMLVAAVTRIFQPGHKFDFAVILEGLQGKGKSTFIKILGRSWFAELNGDFHDSKQMIELMQGAWIMEIPELSGFGRGEVQTIKAFISTTKDKTRLAYAPRAQEFSRQCIFIGSTNDQEYLKDDTGGRRFWPMQCKVEQIDTEALEANIDQIWAEAVVIYRSMRKAQPCGTLPLYLVDAASKEIAVRLQEFRRAETAEDGLAGQIEVWLDQPEHTGDLTDDGGKAKLRNEVCLLQIWRECLNETGQPGTIASRALGQAMRKVPGWASAGHHKFGTRYGKQRAYKRLNIASAV